LHISQNISRQEINSDEFSKVYIEKASGAKNYIERPEAMKLLNDIEKGNITAIHITSLDRLGRNILNLLTVIELGECSLGVAQKVKRRTMLEV